MKNVRADAHVTLRHGRTCLQGLLRDAPADEAAPVLKRYVAVATTARQRFRATKDSRVEDFVAEAPTHPVFVFTPTSNG